MQVICIAACGNDGVIGRDGVLPWSCAIDMRHFRNLTTGKVVLMGRKTADTLPKPLKDRVCLVLTRDRTWTRHGFIPVHTKRDIDRVLRQQGTDELWVIGGEEIYRKYLPIAQVLHLTVLDVDIPDADAHFPLDLIGDWHGVHSQPTTDPKVTFWVLQPNRVQTIQQAPKACRVADGMTEGMMFRAELGRQGLASWEPAQERDGESFLFLDGLQPSNA